MSSRGDRGTILLVEDEAILRMVLTEQLADLGFHAVEAADSSTALAILGGADPLLLMITDVSLPGMDGRRLATEAGRLRPDLPILFSTGDAQALDGWAGYDPETMAVMAKPFPLDDLEGVIVALAARQRHAEPHLAAGGI